MSTDHEFWTPAEGGADGGGSEPTLHCATLGEFVELLVDLYPGDLNVGTARWCPTWWRHAEAISRLDALWRSFEHLRLDPTVGASVWWKEHADHHMPILLAAAGPFRRCKEGDCKPLPAMPVTAPPAGLLRDGPGAPIAPSHT